jgi:hypothetical protein
MMSHVEQQLKLQLTSDYIYIAQLFSKTHLISAEKKLLG